MRRHLFALGVFVCFAGQTIQAQEPPGDPRAGQLVDCGSEKVAIFEDTTSKDGHYALGWTVRPNRKQNPVDWSIYKPDDWGAFYEKHSFIGDEGNEENQAYLLVDGVLDLTAKKFTPIPSKIPCFPGKNHSDISACWSGDQQGVRYALATIDRRFNTAELWLLTIDAQGTRARNLSPEADKAVKGYMRKRDPKDYQRYEVAYLLNGRDGDSGGLLKAAAGVVTIYFDASIPKDDVNHDDGYITLSLPQGTVIRVSKK